MTRNNTGADRKIQLDEFFSAFKKSNRRLSPQDARAEKIFIQNFVSRAAQALDNAISAGLVDPSAQGRVEEPQATATAAPQTQPTQPTQPQGTSLDLDQLKQKTAATKAAGVAAQQQAMQQMDATKKANAAASAADNELVARVKAEKAKPGFQQDKGLLRQAALKGIHESKYDKLNHIFESILAEAPTQSISQFLTRWLTQYMKGINLSGSSSASRIKELINAVEQTWDDDEGEEALTQLAKAAFAVAHAQEAASAPASPASATGATASKDPVNTLFAAFNQLDSQQKQKLLTMISSGK